MPFCGVKVFSFLPSSLPREGADYQGREDAFSLGKNVLSPNPVSAPMPETPHSNAQYGRLGGGWAVSPVTGSVILHVLVHCCPLAAPTVFQTLDTGRNNTKPNVVTARGLAYQACFCYLAIDLGLPQRRTSKESTCDAR